MSTDRTSRLLSQWSTAKDEPKRNLISVASTRDEVYIEISAPPNVSLLTNESNVEVISLNDENSIKTPPPPNISLLPNGSDWNETLPLEAQTNATYNLASEFSFESETTTFHKN